MCRKSHQKWGLESVRNEIAGLRHFLPWRHLLGFFWAIFCMGLCSFLDASWSALGFLDGFLGGLWTQKRVKNKGFFRFLKRLFKAHVCSLGLILVSLVILFGILCKNPGPFWVPKLNFNGLENLYTSIWENTKKNKS